VRGITGDFFSHAFEPVYDYVVARQFLGYFTDQWRDVIKRMLDLCKPGGAVIVHMHASESEKQAE
jgi:chemotaxis methyl-accepting protein methylase